MKELIKVTQNEKGEHLVSAKLLHVFLEVKTDFSNWCKRMFEYGFEEGKDFTPNLTESIGGRQMILKNCWLHRCKKFHACESGGKKKA